MDSRTTDPSTETKPLWSKKSSILAQRSETGKSENRTWGLRVLSMMRQSIYHFMEVSFSICVLKIQAYLILMHFVLLCSMGAACFNKLKVCGNSASSKATCVSFPTAFAHFVSVSHFGDSCIISNVFIIIILLWYL